MNKTRKRLTEADLLSRLAKKHPAPAWAFLTQVRNGTGYGRRVRTADALAMSLWPSRGLELHGFEVKCYRGDWIHELKTPEKAEEIARFCHRWWIVAPDEDVVKTAEIPPAWGLMVPHGSGLAVRKLADLQEAQAPTYPFLGALLRKVSESMVPFESIKSELDGARKSGYESAKAAVAHAKSDLARLQRSVTEFEAASGVKIPLFGGAGDIGAAVAFVQQFGHDAISRQVKSSRTRLATLLSAMDEVIAEFGAEGNGSGRGTCATTTR